MANTKSKSDIKKTTPKKKTTRTKSSVATEITKKPRTVKKKLEVVDEVKKDIIIEAELIKKPTKKKTTRTIVQSKKELTPEEVVAQRKERNRKKYQNQQKKYQDVRKLKEKKIIEVEDRVADTINNNLVKEKDNNELDIKKIEEDDLIKKVTSNTLTEDNKEKERKEKRKTNRKSIHLTQTLTAIKEKVDDKNIPVGKTIEEKSKRSRRIIKESIVYAITLTIINIICIIFIDQFNFLRLFDVKWLNITVTAFIFLLFNFFVAFMLDYFITEIWLRKKRKKRDGDLNGDNWIIEREHQEDIKDKEGK